MKSKSIVTLCLFVLMTIALGGIATAQEPEAPGPQNQQALTTVTNDVATTDIATTDIVTEGSPAHLPDHLNNPESAREALPLLNAEPQVASVATGLEDLSFGFPFCSSQAQCDSICAPIEGTCWRRQCICD